MRALAFALVAPLAVTAVAFAGGDATAKSPKALVIMWDGCRADGLVNGNCENIRKLATGTWQPGYKGAWSLSAKTIPDARTYSFGNHASIMCGVMAAKHDVYFNHQAGRCRVKRWPNWLTRLLNARPSLKAECIVACGDANKAMLQDDRVPFRSYSQDNVGEVEYLAARYAEADAPDAAILFIDHPDAEGHRYGYYPSSDAYLAAIHTNDVLVGKVLDAIAARPTFKSEDWIIIMTADHGGYGQMHGWDESHSKTVPLIVASRHVSPGQMPGCPNICSVPATALDHFGLDLSDMELDAGPVGKDPAATWWKPAELDEGLVFYLPFGGKVRKSVENAVPGGPAVRLIGDEEYFGQHADKDSLGAYLSPGGSADLICAAWLERSTAMFMCEHPSFTISFWLRATPFREGVMPVIANKDLSREGSPGFVITTGARIERGYCGLGVRYGTPIGVDRQIGIFDLEGDGVWTFYALVFAPDGQAWLYQGRRDGKLNWVVADASDALLGSGLPLHLGQDGTGSWRYNYKDKMDDVAIWNRPLTYKELARIHGAGLQGRDLGAELRPAGR